MVGVFSKHSGETPNRTSTPSPRKSPHSSFFTSPVRDDPPALLSPVKVDEATPATPAKERYSPLHPDSGRTQATSSAVSPLSTADVDCVAGRYKVVKTVGVGSFSKVKLATDTRDGKLVALKLTSRKMIATSSRVKSGVESEMEIMKSLKHENIVSVIERIDLPDHVCVALEFVGGGELFDYIADHREKLTLPEVARLFGELLSAVNYLHEHLICHRDLKIENVLLTLSDPLHVKLIDFAFACRLKPLPETATSAETGTAADHRRPLGYLPPVELLTARCGSEEYTAPEVILQQPYDGRRTDAWALGVILFAMLTGELPFTLEPGQRPRAFYKRIAMAEYRFPDALHGNEDNKRSSGEGIEDVRLQKAQDLVKKILVTSAKTRLTVKEMLVHPFLN
ncbi:kinase-like domain-containing protein [Zopfochytrium polystomum]|nr:kinase-like domain-containing protein [Zopfochytrium polystomum]